MKIVTLAVSIIGDIVGIWSNITSNYYYYALGRSISGFATKTFILVDYILATNLIVPTEPWIRYRYGPYYRPSPADCGMCDKAKLEAGDYSKCETARAKCVSNIDREMHTYNDIKKEKKE